MPAARSLAAVDEEFQLGAGRPLRIKRPKEPGVLLDLDEVHEHYTKDEYMPYWATLWPVSKFLTHFMLTGQLLGKAQSKAPLWTPPPPGSRALELGCGLGLPGCGALSLGLHVTFTDYDESALEWAVQNARLNAPSDGPAAFRALAIDWRTPPPEMVDLVIASDLTYEARNVEPLVMAFAAVLKPHACALVADQNRPYRDEFERCLVANTFAFEKYAVGPEPAIDAEIEGTIYVVRRA